MSWKSVLPVAVGLCVYAPAGAQSRSTFVHERDVRVRLTPQAAWNGRKIIGVESTSVFSRSHLLYSIDPANPYGDRQEFLFTIPESSGTHIVAFSGTPDGAIALAGSAYTDDSRGTAFLAWISPDRKEQLVTRISPYAALEMAMAADGKIWTAGFLRDSETFREDHDVIRRYEPGGRLIGSWKVRAKIKPGQPDATAGSFLMASSDRVGWLTLGGEYIEFSLEGTELNRFLAPDWVNLKSAGANKENWYLSGAALSPDNELALCIARLDTWQVLILDRQRRTWTPSDLVGLKGWAKLMGFDGQRLIMFLQLGDAGTIGLYRRAE